MRCLLAPALSLVLVAGCAASPPPAASPPEKAELPRAPKAQAIQAMVGALTDGGHACKIDKDGDAICDADKKGSPTFVIVYTEEVGLGPYMGFVSSFKWKDADGCASHASKLIELTNKMDLLRLGCTPELMTFAMTAPLPERGLTSGDVAKMCSAFLGYVHTVLAATDLVKSLQ